MSKQIRTEVASEPVLHTVRTFKSFPSPPLPMTRLISQSPPHFDIALFLPTSSFAMAFPSAINSFAVSLTSFPAAIDSLRTFSRRLVAAPRLTAVGLAVKR